MAWLAPIVQAGASMAGQQASANAANQQDAQARAALAALQNIQLPDVEKQKLLLELPQLVGQYNPQAEQTYSMNPSAMENIQINPQFEQAQLDTLGALQERGETGLTASERSVLNQIRRDSAGQEQARQGQILQEMGNRGIGGSGIELAARLSSSQHAADAANQAADKEAAMIQERQLAALQQSAALAGQVRSQDFGEKSDVAKAQDYINQFNTANKQAVQTRNVGSQNTAQQQNLKNAQDMSNQQIQLQNSQQQYNKELDQQRFSNEMAKTGHTVPAMNNLGNIAAAEGQRQGQMYSQIGTGLGEAIVGADKYFTQDQKPASKLPQSATDYLEALKRGTGQ